MKSLADLKKLREASLSKVNMRETQDGIRVVVGMATCGIAAGARPVLNKIVEEVGARGLNNVTVSQVGCIGECALEPIVEVYDNDGQRFTYCLVSPEKAVEIVEVHVVGGEVLTEYLLENNK